MRKNSEETTEKQQYYKCERVTHVNIQACRQRSAAIALTELMNSKRIIVYHLVWKATD